MFYKAYKDKVLIIENLSDVTFSKEYREASYEADLIFVKNRNSDGYYIYKDTIGLTKIQAREEKMK